MSSIICFLTFNNHFLEIHCSMSATNYAAVTRRRAKAETNLLRLRERLQKIYVFVSAWCFWLRERLWKYMFSLVHDAFIFFVILLIAHCWPFFQFLQRSSWAILTSFACAWALSVRIKRPPLATPLSLSAILSQSRMQLFLEYGIVLVSLGFYQVGKLLF